VRAFHPEGNALAWEIAVHGAAWPGELALELEAFDLPQGARVSLEDLGDGSVRAIEPGTSITIAAKRDQRLRLTVALDPVAMPNATRVDGLRYVYPNPFDRRAGLVFGLALAGDVSAEIYDVGGRRVRRLTASRLAAGERVLVWDGTDQAGRDTAPGIYLARYRAGLASGTARLVKVE
jgi:hypothetical protein